MDLIPKVVQAVAGENFTVYAYFSDGTIRLLDTKPLLEKGGGREKQSREEQGDEKASHIKGYRGQEKERKKERAFSTPVSRTKGRHLCSTDVFLFLSLEGIKTDP